LTYSQVDLFMDFGKKEAKEYKEFEEFEETLSRSVPRCGLTAHLSNLYLRLNCLPSAVFFCAFCALGRRS
jgi:hypothetical protein